MIFLSLIFANSKGDFQSPAQAMKKAMNINDFPQRYSLRTFRAIKNRPYKQCILHQ